MFPFQEYVLFGVSSGRSVQWCPTCMIQHSNVENEAMFPYTIDFLKELVTWLDSVITKHEKPKIRIMTFGVGRNKRGVNWVEGSTPQEENYSNILNIFCGGRCTAAFLGRGLLSFGNPLLPLVGGTIHLSGAYDEELR